MEASLARNGYKVLNMNRYEILDVHELLGILNNNYCRYFRNRLNGEAALICS